MEIQMAASAYQPARQFADQADEQNRLMAELEQEMHDAEEHKGSKKKRGMATAAENEIVLMDRQKLDNAEECSDLLTVPPDQGAFSQKKSKNGMADANRNAPTVRFNQVEEREGSHEDYQAHFDHLMTEADLTNASVVEE